MKKILKPGFLFFSISFLLTSFQANYNSNHYYNNPASSEMQQNRLKEGDKAPDIILQNPDGDTIKLSSLKGKMVLIDFWASWCGPCRRNNPDLVSLYKQYKDRKFKNGDGFTIFSVSLDYDKEYWTQAIKKDKLEWEYHLSDLKKWNSPIVKRYNINYIPQSVLIDGNGKILALDMEFKRMKYFLKSNVRRK